jgi:hypothetical protein
LIEQRQNRLIVACLITVSGALLAIFGKDASADSSRATPGISIAKSDALFEGQVDISSDAYRLWLADKYQITKNDVFDRFVFAERTFRTLNEALAAASEIEAEKLASFERTQVDRMAERTATDAEIELAVARAKTEWERDRPRMIAGLTVLALVVAVIALVAG